MKMAPGWHDPLVVFWRWTLVPSLLVLCLSWTHTLGDDHVFNAEVIIMKIHYPNEIGAIVYCIFKFKYEYNMNMNIV